MVLMDTSLYFPRTVERKCGSIPRTHVRYPYPEPVGFARYHTLDIPAFPHVKPLSSVFPCFSSAGIQMFKYDNVRSKRLCHFYYESGCTQCNLPV